MPNLSICNFSPILQFPHPLFFHRKIYFKFIFHPFHVTHRMAKKKKNNCVNKHNWLSAYIQANRCRQNQVDVDKGVSCQLHVLYLSASVFYKWRKMLVNLGNYSQFLIHDTVHVYGVIQSLSHVWLCNPIDCSTPGSSVFLSWSLLKFMSVESVMLSNHLILCHPLLPLPSIFPSIRVFSRVGSFHQVAKVLELQQQSLQWIFRVDIL